VLEELVIRQVGHRGSLLAEIREVVFALPAEELVIGSSQWLARSKGNRGQQRFDRDLIERLIVVSIDQNPHMPSIDGQ
jgi:hypothetical protein